MAAMPATARRSEPHSSKLQADLSEHHAPMRATQQPTSRASTPRPSISPLSTSSKPNRSPEATGDTINASVAVQDEIKPDHAVDGTTAETSDLQDDRSSSLSEPEDEQDEHERLENDMEGGEEHVPLVAQRSLEDDSEAETERLEQTPQKLRQHAESIGRTPSKLSQAATMEDELSEPPSPMQLDTGAASSTSTIGTLVKKRKRSDTAESPLTSAESDLEECPRKRSHELPLQPEAEETDHVVAANGTEERAADTVEEVPAPEEEPGTAAPVALTKSVKSRKGKLKGRKAKDAHTESEVEQVDEAAAPEPEPAEETAAKSEGERQAKAAAASAFENVAKQFTAFREKLYDERLATMNAELNLLAQQECQHPEYLRQVACVNARREKQMREAQAYYHYRLTSIRQRTLGDRSQLHSQYHQHIREVREHVMYKLGEDWYNLQKERRQQHQDKDEAYIYTFPTKKSTQILQQAKYNQEVSVLSGVAKYVGFPAAPDISGAEGDSLEDDLKAMKIAKRVPQPTAPAQPVYQRLPTVPTQNEQLAHQQFIEQNAWAQPQRPVHNHGTPNLTHTPDWVDQPGHQSSARSLIRNLSGQLHRTGSPYTTPMPQKRQGLPEHSSSGTVAVGSDGADPSSSVLAALSTSDRMLALQHASTSTPQPSPLHVGKQRQMNGGMERELTGFRNISNISGISGASTLDAAPPDSAEKERELHKTLPALLSEASARQQAFDTSQLHRLDENEGREKEAYANVGFRPQEGAFGTPAPLPVTSAAP